MKVTSPGSSEWRVFNINASGKSIEISNLKAIGGSEIRGAVLYNGAGIVSLLKVTISDGNGTEDGNGIYNIGSLTLNYSTVSNNGSYSGGGIGAGIYNSGTLTLLNSTIADNETDQEPAGIYMNGGTAYIVNTTITNNDCEGGGGGGGLQLNAGSVFLLNSLIINNTNGGDQSDIYTGGNTVNAYYCWYSAATGTIGGSNNNTFSYASNDLSALAYNGGFTNTSAIASAANISSKAGSGVRTGTYEDSGTKYAFWDGAEWKQLTSPTSTAIGVTEITADQRGYYRTSSAITRGAYQYNGIVAKIGTATSWTADGNYTTIDGAYNAASTGNIIEIAGTAIYEFGITLDENKTISIQGAGAASTIVQAATTRETASDRVFTITDGIIVLEDMAIKHGYPADDAYYGGGIYSDAAALTLNDCIISGNEDYWNEYGGGVYTVGSGPLTISNTTISHNTAKYRGGGIFHESTGNLTITGSTISYNSTDTDDGGGISCSGVCTVEITNSLFDNNYAALGGGGIYLGYGTITLTNTDVTNNTAHTGLGGGILHNNSTPITITGGSISNNTAEDGYGGGFSKLDVSTVNISNATFDGNTSNNDGGNGGYGGAIYCENGSTFNLNDLTIKNNNAIYDGGGVYFNDGDITTTISNSTIHGNTAGNWGGGLALVAGNHEVTNSTINNNNQTAAKGGGGLAIWNGTTALKNVSIVGNTSAGKGGGVYLEASSTLTVINTMIADNTAASGSDYYYDSGTLTDGGYNIVEDQAGASTGVNKTFTEATNITGQQANLFGTGLTTQTLADNGGPTQTLAIESGSFAIAAGIWDASITTDQRGEARHEFTPTIGAYEPRYAGYWTGTTSSDWNTTTNWDSGSVAGASDDVIIPDVDNDPEVGTTGTATCNDLTIKSGATLTLKSTSSGTGSLIVEGTATGNITVERFLTADKWHYISGQTNISGNFNTLGMDLGSPGSSSNSFFRWDESFESNGATGYWIDILNGSDGTGSNTLMDEEGFEDCRGYAVTYDGTVKTLSLSGVPYTSTQSIPITYTSTSTNPGANLVGNPFTSSIAINSTITDIGNDYFLYNKATVLHAEAIAIYLWDDTENEYVTINNSSDATYVQPGQGFMVIAKDGGGSLSFDNAIRKHGSASFYKSINNEFTRVELSIKDSDNRTNNTSIVFAPNMTGGLDPSFDAMKLKGNPNIALYTRLVEDNGVDFAIQALPIDNIQTSIIPVGVDVAEPTILSFSISQEGMEDNPIYLEDKELGTSTNLIEEDYSALVSQSGVGRFFIHLSPLDIDESIATNNLVQIWTSNNTINIFNDNNYVGDIKVVNMFGQTILTTKLNGEQNQKLLVNAPTGYYIINIVTKNGVVNKKVYLR